MTTTSVGMRCPECARERTPVRTLASLQTDPTLTYALMGVNALLALASGSSSLLSRGGLFGPAVADGEVWRIVTSGFLHSGLLHLLFNLYALYVLGGLLEPMLGRARFAVVYGVSLLAGSLGALLLSPDALTVGASGAIFGLMGAAIVVMRSRGINPMESGLGMWLGISLVFTLLAPNISVGGHLGGLAGGALAAFVLVELGPRLRLPRPLQTAMAAGVGVLAAAACLAVAGG